MASCAAKQPESKAQVDLAEPALASSASVTVQPATQRKSSYRRGELEAGRVELRLPSGWQLSRRADVTIAESADRSAVFACMSIAETTDKDVLRAELERLLDTTKISMHKHANRPWRPNWQRPDATRQSGSLTFALNQTESAEHNDERGFALAGMTTSGERRLFVLAFAREGDDKAVADILGMIDGLGSP
ncbi:MAG: hypothetical protein U0271_03265 [Polyangiaceae bacterium]